MGGASNSSATTFNVGDDATNKQYRAVLHFDTSALPDKAVITSVTLKVNAQEMVGTNPFSTLSGLRVDICNPFFGTTFNLQVGGFQATASVSALATFGTTPASNWYSASMNTTGW